jgi:glutamate racemase
MFDSGAGGLSVLAAFRALAPEEPVVYFADTAYFPYGPRPAAEVRKRSFAIANHLMALDVKAIVVACNTASAAAITDLREAFPVPFVGMVPGLKPAARRSQSGVVAILATPGTLDGGLYQRVADEFGRGTKVINVPGTGLAQMVERGEIDAPAVRERLTSLLQPAVDRGADTVVLGCTHYHFVAPLVRTLFPALTLIDTSEPVARQALRVLDEGGLRSPAGTRGTLDLIVTGDRVAFRRTMVALGFTEGVGK